MADISKIELPSGDVYDIKDDYVRDKTNYTKETSGDPVIFSDGADNFPVSEVIINIVPNQPGTGDPSSENIRPIVGWDGAEIRNAGKNLWSGDALISDMQSALPTATVNEEDRTVYFKNNTPRVGPFCGEFEGVRRGYQFAENTQYTFIFTAIRSGSSLNMRIYYTNGTYDAIPVTPEIGVKGTSIVVSNDQKSIAYLTKLNSAGNVTFYADECGIFEGDLTVSDFEAYIGTSRTVTFPQQVGTVYGGQLNMTTGQLTVTHGVIASYDGETLSGEWISDRDVYSPNTSPTIGAQVVYELATPQVYQVPSAQISSLKGITHIYATTGSVQKLVYARDTFNSVAQLVNNKVSDNLYSLSISGNRITLLSSSGETSYIDLPVYDGTVV